MYDAKKNNMWPQQHQQFMGSIVHRHSCHQSSTPIPSPSPSSSSASSSLLQVEPLHTSQQRLDNHSTGQQHSHHRHGIMEVPIQSNPRASRNLAEKQRRDNLNSNIATMAGLVPAVAGSSRRMDKISILRLAAAFLRSQYTLGPGPESFLPRQYDFDLEQYIIENLVANAGFFLVVTTSGKIVYISRYIEHQLGHAQHELLGQSLYNFVCPEDCEELQRNLTPDGFQHSTSTSNVSGTPSTATTEENSNSSDDPAAPKTDRNFKPQRRSFNIRMSQKALNKREHGQYECLQISGQLRLANAFHSQGSNSNRSTHCREISTTGNDIVFVGIARMVKKRTITELSLLEATKDEYVTRHLVDGRIIFCDHRISVVAGYMTEEVSGLNAFKFMHKEDVRWTMIALRQMYDRGEGFGSSCYRLLSKTGQFIYLRTHGYLEFDKDTQTVESFVCVNTLVSEKEGMKLVKDMKERFSAVTSDPAKAIFTPSGLAPIMAPDTQRVDQKATVEDPVQLEDAITHLIRDLPSPSVTDERRSPSPLPDNQYYKAAIYSRGLPPAAIQATKIGIPSTDCKSPPENNMLMSKMENERRRKSLLSNEIPSRTQKPRDSHNAPVAGPSSTDNYKNIELQMGYVKSEGNKMMVFDVENEDSISSVEDRSIESNEREEIYGRNTTTNRLNIGNVSSPVYNKPSNNNLQEKRAATPRKRMSQNIQEKERRYSRKQQQLGNKTISGCQRIDTRILSTCQVTRIRETEVLSPNKVDPGKLNNFDKDIEANVARSNSRKRSRSGEEFSGIRMSKRKNTTDIILNNFTPNGEQNDCVKDRMIYYANDSDSSNLCRLLGNSPISSTDDLGSEGESCLNVVIQEEGNQRQSQQVVAPASISMDNLGEGGDVGSDGGGVALDGSSLESIQVYQRFNPAHLLNSTDDSVQQIHNDELDEDLHEGMLSPSLDADPDLMKTFADLQTVICNEKTIDEANVNQFTASDQAVNEGIRRSQFQLEKSIALRESQLSVLKRDLDNPALQVQRENFTQLQAEHNKQKQMLKSLQQDHLILQVNVQHNVGV